MPKDLSIKTKNQIIKGVEYVKHLGIYFDYNMKWDMWQSTILLTIREVFFK